MKYQTKNDIEFLYNGVYKNIEYYIISYGLYPCAYIAIPSDNPLYEIKYYDMYESEFYINVHGGFTYSQHSLMGINTDKWILGWDYAHCDDYIYG